QAFDKTHPATGDCNGCHTTSPTFFTNQSGSSAKPANHIPTNAPCAQCHTTAGNYAAYVMGATGHAGIINNCAQCHAYGLSFYNIAAPTLKQPSPCAMGHIPSNPPNGTCCHNARDRLALRPVARLATTPPASPTTTPKSGTPAKPPTHIATTNNCQSCHTTVAWLPVRIVDHTQVIGTCVSCHNGQIA